MYNAIAGKKAATGIQTSKGFNWPKDSDTSGTRKPETRPEKWVEHKLKNCLLHFFGYFFMIFQSTAGHLSLPCYTEVFKIHLLMIYEQKERLNTKFKYINGWLYM